MNTYAGNGVHRTSSKGTGSFQASLRVDGALASREKNGWMDPFSTQTNPETSDKKAAISTEALEFGKVLDTCCEAAKDIRYDYPGQIVRSQAFATPTSGNTPSFSNLFFSSIRS